MNTKVCTECYIEKPETQEFFGTLKNGKNGLNPKCRDCKREIGRQYRLHNKENINKRKREYYQEVAKYQYAEYYQNNKEKCNERQRIYKIRRRETDHYYSLVKSLKSSITYAIKNNSKSTRGTDLLGCSVEEYKLYLEKQFKEGMSWKNYGKTGWHIDHIRPVSQFDLTDPEQQKECFHYSNTQPLWSKENQSKGGYPL